MDISQYVKTGYRKRRGIGDENLRALAEMHNGHSRYSPHCANFTAGLAFTGCRVGEAREIAWRDLDFEAGEIVIRGDPQTGTTTILTFSRTLAHRFRIRK